MHKLMLFMFTFFVLLLSARPAYAYLDPGTGSMVLQLLLAGLAGVLVVLKLFWHKILALFGIGKGKSTIIKRVILIRDY